MSGCKLSDLRTDEIKQNIDARDSERKAKALITKMSKAHGNPTWQAHKTYEIDFKEEFYKLKFAAPFPGGGATVKIAYAEDNYDGRLTFVEGKKAGEEWGLSDWKSWSKKKDGEIKWKHSKKIKFWLPTYQYFIQFPMKIQEADFIRYAGTKNLNGTDCEVLFASWKTDEPQKDLDQYLIYLNAETKRIHALEYTVRGAGSWLHGACLYLDYHELKGMIVPKTMKVLGPKIDWEDQKIFHQMEILDIRFDKVPLSKISLKAPQ